MVELVLATGNPHKVQELRAILEAEAGAGRLRLIGLADLPGHASFHEPAETGTTFAQNATIKALSYAVQTGRLCLADDSGLEIDALGGRPGVISSHYCTDGRDEGMTRHERDLANNERVLRELDGVPPEKRGARFVCVMVVAGPGDERRIAARSDANTGTTAQGLLVARGTFEGRVGMPPKVPRGENGFGYDPLFLVAPDFQRTSAELPIASKNALSHRAAAAKELVRAMRAQGLIGGN